MYPRNPYSIHGIGDRSQTGRQPSRTSIPISQPVPQPQPQSQQQQVPKPEAKKEEPPKPTQPARQFSKPEPQVPKQAEPKKYQQKDTTSEPKRESPIPPPATATFKQPPPPPPPATDAVKQPPPLPPQPVNLSPSESNKAEELSIVPVDQGKAIVKGSNPEPEKSLQQGIKEDITSLTRRLAELHAQHKLLNADQKQKGQAEMGVGVHSGRRKQGSHHGFRS